MFKELNDGELAPFTVVKRAAEGAGGVEWLRLDRASAEYYFSMENSFGT